MPRISNTAAHRLQGAHPTFHSDATSLALVLPIPPSAMGTRKPENWPLPRATTALRSTRLAHSMGRAQASAERHHRVALRGTRIGTRGIRDAINWSARHSCHTSVRMDFVPMAHKSARLVLSQLKRSSIATQYHRPPALISMCLAGTGFASRQQINAIRSMIAA